MEWLCLLLEQAFYVDGIEGDMPLGEFWNIKGLECLVVERGRTLWQHKGLMGLTTTVDVAEIGFAIEPVVPLRGKDEPTGVA